MAKTDFRLGRVILGSTFLTASALTALSVGATHYLATADLGTRVGPNAAQRLALGRRDPETTGSIRAAANASRLDPCVAASRFPAAP